MNHNLNKLSYKKVTLPNALDFFFISKFSESKF